MLNNLKLIALTAIVAGVLVNNINVGVSSYYDVPSIPQMNDPI